MGDPQRELARDQRDVLWRDLVDFVLRCDFGDVVTTLEAGDGAQARELAANFRDGMRVLDDLGWDKLDPRDSYTLTTGDDQLRRLLEHCRQQARGYLQDEHSLDRDQFAHYEWDDDEWAQHCEESRRLIDHQLDLCRVCDYVLEETA